MNQRIFVVDDDPFWTAMLTGMLKEIGYNQIFNFESGSDCVNNLHLNPEIVFLDYQMDDINGIEVLEKIKEYFPEIKVIFCTAYEDLSIAVDAMDKGSFDYLLKGNASKEEVRTILDNLNNF
jgi:DNA-binding NtrC family response regulator